MIAMTLTFSRIGRLDEEDGNQRQMALAFEVPSKRRIGLWIC